MIVANLLISTMCLLSPRGNTPAHGVVPIHRRDTGTVTYSVEINAATWEWSVSITNRSPYRLVLMYSPINGEEFLRFSIYDSSITKLHRGCVFVQPYFGPTSRKRAKKIVPPKKERNEIKADSTLVSIGPTEMNLRNVFCFIKPSDLIQYVNERLLKVYDPATGALIREMKIKIATRFFKGNEVGILKDSAVTHL